MIVKVPVTNPSTPEQNAIERKISVLSSPNNFVRPLNPKRNKISVNKPYDTSGYQTE